MTNHRPAERILFQPSLTEALTSIGAGSPLRHLCIAGPVGCGQGLAATNLARLERDAPGPVVKVLPAELSVAHAAEAIDRLRMRWTDARDGVLYLPALELLLSDPNAVPVLAALREKMATDPSVRVLLAGDREAVAQMHALSPELYQRFRHASVHPFTPAQLTELALIMVSRAGFTPEHSFRDDVEPLMRKVRSVGDLANGRVAEALVRSATARAAAAGRKQVRASDIDVQSLRTVDTDGPGGFAELDALIGLADIKETVRQWVANADLLLRREQLGLQAGGLGQHMVFQGPAGTAKTTVARIVGRIMAETGVLSSGHLIETQRADLVGEHSEQTTRRVVEAVKRSLGGVLFIDEAYTLTAKDSGTADAGREAVDTLLKLMEDYRDEFVVIVAGYPVHMEQFLNSNPGLRSRFVRNLQFPEYDVTQLLEILHLLGSQRGFRIDPTVDDLLTPELSIALHYPNFGNGRHVRNLLEMAIVRQAGRLTSAATDDELRLLLPTDFTEQRSTAASISPLG